MLRFCVTKKVWAVSGSPASKTVTQKRRQQYAVIYRAKLRYALYIPWR